MVAGFAVLIWFAWKYPNFIIWLIVLLSLPRIYSLFRKRTKRSSVISKSPVAAVCNVGFVLWVDCGFAFRHHVHSRI